MKKVGEPAGSRVAEGSDEWAVKFTVTDIEVDPICTSIHAAPADNGHLVAITIEATTGPEPGFSSVYPNGLSFGSGWKVISSNGTTANSVNSNSASNCFEAGTQINGLVGGAEKIVGKVVLDVPDTAGTLVFADYNSTGWEWEYGAN